MIKSLSLLRRKDGTTHEQFVRPLGRRCTRRSPTSCRG